VFWKRGGWLRTTLMVTVVLVRRALVRWSLACTTHCTHEALVRWTWDFTLTAAVAVQNTIHFQQAMMITLSATLKRTGIVHIGHIDSRIKFCLSDMKLRMSKTYHNLVIRFGMEPNSLCYSPAPSVSLPFLSQLNTQLKSKRTATSQAGSSWPTDSCTHHILVGGVGVQSLTQVDGARVGGDVEVLQTLEHVQQSVGRHVLQTTS